MTICVHFLHELNKNQCRRTIIGFNTLPLLIKTSRGFITPHSIITYLSFLCKQKCKFFVKFKNFLHFICLLSYKLPIIHIKNNVYFISSADFNAANQLTDNHFLFFVCRCIKRFNPSFELIIIGIKVFQN